MDGRGSSSSKKISYPTITDRQAQEYAPNYKQRAGEPYKRTKEVEERLTEIWQGMKKQNLIFNENQLKYFFQNGIDNLGDTKERQQSLKELAMWNLPR